MSPEPLAGVLVEPDGVDSSGAFVVGISGASPDDPDDPDGVVDDDGSPEPLVLGGGATDGSLDVEVLGVLSSGVFGLGGVDGGSAPDIVGSSGVVADVVCGVLVGASWVRLDSSWVSLDACLPNEHTFANFAATLATVATTSPTIAATPAAIDAPNVKKAAASAASMVAMMSPRTVLMVSRTRPRTAATRALVVCRT